MQNEMKQKLDIIEARLDNIAKRVDTMLGSHSVINIIFQLIKYLFVKVFALLAWTAKIIISCQGCAVDLPLKSRPVKPQERSVHCHPLVL